MKTKTLAATALSLMLCLPLFAKSQAPTSSPDRASTSSPSSIGNISSTEQSLRYKRPSKRRISSGSPSEVRDISRSEQSLRYKGPSHRRHSTKRHTRKLSRQTSKR